MSRHPFPWRDVGYELLDATGAVIAESESATGFGDIADCANHLHKQAGTLALILRRVCAHVPESVIAKDALEYLRREDLADALQGVTSREELRKAIGPHLQWLNEEGIIT